MARRTVRRRGVGALWKVCALDGVCPPERPSVDVLWLARAVWLDLSGPEDQVPSFNTKVVLKVARLSAAPGEGAVPEAPARAAPRAAAPRSVPAAAPASAARPATAAAPPAVQQSAHSTADMLGLFDSGASAPSPAVAASPPAPAGASSSHVPDDFFSSAPSAVPAAGAGSRAPATSGGDPFWNSGSAGASPVVQQAATRPAAAPVRGGPIGGPIGGLRPGAAPAPAPAKGGGNLLTENLFGGF